MTLITLAREDINNPLHPFLWEQLCERLDVDPDSDVLELWIDRARGDADYD